MLPEDLVKWWDNFKVFVLDDLRKAQRGGVQLGLISLTVVAIETLSGFYVGKEACRCTFESFVKRYMPKKYADYAQDLYACIRNGLLHDTIVKKVGGRTFYLTGKKGERHLETAEDGSGGVYLNRESFAEDFLKAAESYFADLERDTCLQENARKRIDKASYLVVGEVPPPAASATLSSPPQATGRWGGTSRQPSRGNVNHLY